MIYLANPTTDVVRSEMSANPHLGAIATPRQRNRVPVGVPVGVDNGCFTDPEGFGDGTGFLDYLTRFDRSAILFASAPDIVGDWPATLDRSGPWFDRLRSLGYPPAVVLQDGATAESVPWNDVDAVFVGGSTDWKLGPEAARLVQRAKVEGKWAHMGRVNSRKRLAYASWIGCDSADGTFLVFGPTVNLPRLCRWLVSVNSQEPLVPFAAMSTVLSTPDESDAA